MADDHGTVLTLDDRDLLRRLDDLGVGQLRTDGATPPTDGWADVERRSRAHGRRRRLPLVVAVAAVLVLVAGLLALARRDDPRAVVTGPPTELPYLLPPEEAIEVQVSVTSRPDPQNGEEVVLGYQVVYRVPGASNQTSMALFDTSVDIGGERVVGTTVPTQQEAQTIHLGDGRTAVWPRLPDRSSWPAQAIDAPPLTDASLLCEPSPVGLDGTPVPEVPIDEWSPFLAPRLDGRLGQFSVGVSISGEVFETCELATFAPQLAEAVALLRPVGATEWQAFLDQHVESSLGSDLGMPNVDFEGRADAQAAVEEAFEGLTIRDDAGRYVNVESGDEVGRLDALFTEIRDRLGGEPEAQIEVTDIAFLTPEQAWVDAQATLQLPSGTFTTEVSGTVVRLGGRWLVTLPTLEAFVARAAYAPTEAPVAG